MDTANPNRLSRRRFVRTAATASVGTAAFPYVVRGATENRPVKVGMVGCGGRGTGAMLNCIDGDSAVRITALADLFPDRLERTRNRLKAAKGQTVEDRNCFLGFDAFAKLIETDVELVILATPPHFRPEHLARCVAAGKHVFIEKPAAVDAPGIRSMIASGEKAKSKGLAIGAGSQRRHQKPYVETIRRIHDGAIGEVVAAQCYWNGGKGGPRSRRPSWKDMEWMIRDWYNWSWLSGDHVVEQHVHNLDVINWVLGTHVDEVVAMGARHRRVNGDQYDCFSADLTFPGDVHVHSMCRQIAGCANNVSERVIGTKGTSNCRNSLSTVADYKSRVSKGRDPYVQEHTDLIASIREGKPINEARNLAWATMTAIMIRMSAYTGKKVTWDEAIDSNERLGPATYTMGDYPELMSRQNNIPVPGVAGRRRA